MTLRIGSLFSGYGGLDMGVMSVLGGEVAWHVEFDDAPSRILAHHWPDVPNYGDVTTVDWAAVPPVDVLTGGFPCQDVSLAGARAGLKDGTRSGLWSEFARAIDALRPRLVVIENVRGLLSAAAHSDMEPCTWCVGDEPNEPVLRAHGAVLGDMADLGYDTRWVGVRASDAGAPHGRFRVFIVAHPQGEPWSVGDGDDVRAGGGAVGRVPHAGASVDAHPANNGHERAGRAWDGRSGLADGSELAPDSGGGELQRRGEHLSVVGASGSGEGTPGEWERHGDAPGDSGSAFADAPGSGRDRRSQEPVGEPVGGTASAGSGGVPEWREFEPAIRRWEHITGRLAPAPALPTGRGGDARLSAQFVEWMMGLPEGHVTNSAIGLTRAQQLKALGNGVVPQQAALALRLMGVTGVG